MELSAITQEYSLPLTRPESRLVDQLSPVISAGSEDLYRQRIKDLASARAALDRLPDRKTVERQGRMERAALLKARLKMLRQMIPFMTPSAAKSLNSEMKQIAAQLSSLTGESGGGGGNQGGGAIHAVAVTAAQAREPASAAETAPDTAVMNVSGFDDGGTRQEEPDSSEHAVRVNGVKSGAEEHQLKEAVEELGSLYRVVLAALKRKQRRRSGSGHFLHIRAYADIPDRTGGLAVNV